MGGGSFFKMVILLEAVRPRNAKCAGDGMGHSEDSDDDDDDDD